MSTTNGEWSGPSEENVEDDQSVSTDDTSQLLGDASSRFRRFGNFILKTTTLKILWISVLLLIAVAISGTVIWITAPKAETNSTTFTTATPSATVTTTSPSETTTTPSETISTTPEKTTMTSESTTRLPTCPYKDWYKLSCPAGATWACWADAAKRNEENCSQWGKIYGWAMLHRTWPKEDCYCCSKINCVFP